MDNLQKLRQENLNSIFHPRSIAIIGTNNVKGTVPHDILDNILKSEFPRNCLSCQPQRKEHKGDQSL